MYKKSDGTYTAVMTETPLHYFNAGVWEEINNAMILDGDFYTNTDNLFNVSLPESINSTESLTVENDGYELSFNVEDISQSSAVVENNIVESDSAVEAAQDAIAQTQSSVTYNNVAENTDLQYIVTPNAIKENIIVSDKESVKDTYTFTFQSNGLEAEKLEDGSVVFKNAQGEIKFTIPQPVMTDANLEFSYDIGVALVENSDGTISLDYTPSKEWLNSSVRSYPVTIDPAISVENSSSTWIEDTFVADSENYSTARSTNYYDVYFGIVADTTDYNVDEIQAEVYTKFDVDALDALGSNLVFTEAQYLTIGSFYNCKLFAKKLATPVDLTTVTWATKPTVENEVIDYYTSPFSSVEDGEPSYIHFNLTKALSEWYNDDSDNNGNNSRYACYNVNCDRLEIHYVDDVDGDGDIKSILPSTSTIRFAISIS